MSRGPYESPAGWCRHTGDWLSPRRGVFVLKCYLPPVIFQGENQGRTESSREAVTGHLGQKEGQGGSAARCTQLNLLSLLELLKVLSLPICDNDV